jgi:DNA (cytosine-5)-methyltransferase 1
MKVLNLYCGIGGNRKLWQNVQVDAVEYNPEIANIYKTFFPNDNVLVQDAHQFLLENFSKYDFIWTSPPCPSHSRIRHMTSKTNLGSGRDRNIIYPDMKLYQEILLLQNYASCNWVVENVIPYYEPLIPGKKIGRHLFWTNFRIGNFDIKNANIRHSNIRELEKENNFDLSPFKIKTRKDTILRNCVNSEIGNYIFQCSLNKTVIINNQINLFYD